MNKFKTKAESLTECIIFVRYIISTIKPQLKINRQCKHTGGPVKNGASKNHQICLEDSSFRNRKAFP